MDLRCGSQDKKENRLAAPFKSTAPNLRRMLMLKMNQHFVTRHVILEKGISQNVGHLSRILPDLMHFMTLKLKRMGSLLRAKLQQVVRDPSPASPSRPASTNIVSPIGVLDFLVLCGPLSPRGALITCGHNTNTSLVNLRTLFDTLHSFRLARCLFLGK